MVTRKPVGSPIVTSNASQDPVSKADPPYPTTPTEQTATKLPTPEDVLSTRNDSSPDFALIDMRDAMPRTRSDSDASSHGTWASDDDEEDETQEFAEVEVPAPLAVDKSHNKSQAPERLPSILRPGPPKATKPLSLTGTSTSGYEDVGNPWVDDLITSPAPEQGRQPSNNPYHQNNGFPVEDSQSAWQSSAPPPPIPSTAPPPPPANLPPTTATDVVASYESPDDPHSQAWETVLSLSVPPKGQPPFPPVTQSVDDQKHAPQQQSGKWWDTITSDLSEQLPEVVSSPPGPPPKTPPPPLSQHASDKSNNPMMPQLSSTSGFEQQGATPINKPAETNSTTTISESPRTRSQQQRNEHYQIKHVNWLDQSAMATPSPGMQPGMRRSPILTQSVNGPCPLLALVNALVLSTPPGLSTALTETLETREQVSLGFLLDAVFDELTSGRRSDSNIELPDVSELYSFLLALHTGMNVNPRFIPIGLKRKSVPGIYSPGRGKTFALPNVGSFEETREMHLYSTFGIPLIHGWIPAPNEPAYEAFQRSAPTFEDAQNIQFLEFDLNQKLRSTSLTVQEQQTLYDIQMIKTFLQSWSTQLTEEGLDNIHKTLQPGQIAILFRNDHFSTLYKEPRHGSLMTLVTDAGYASHDEIVWESLVDVSGGASELFSGDFRAVSHDRGASTARLNGASSSKSTEIMPTPARPLPPQSTSKKAQREDVPPPLPGPRPKQQSTLPAKPTSDDLNDLTQNENTRRTTEQEDHDLALALQLQEEEDDQQRQANERRRREQELSERFISNESENHGPRPAIPPRRGNRNSSAPTTTTTTTTTPAGRPGVNRPSAQNDPDAPPSYEQAASDQPYHPTGQPGGANHAAVQGNPLGAYDALRRQQQAALQSTSTFNSPPDYGPQSGGRRRPDGTRIRRRSSQVASMVGAFPQPDQGPGGAPSRINQAASLKDADERCVMM